jgi:hypothetical protein
MKESSLDQSLEVAKKFVKETMPFYDPENTIDRVDLMTSLHPYIANAMYAHGNEVIERERMETLITLARTLDNANIEKVVKNLRYVISIKK